MPQDSVGFARKMDMLEGTNAITGDEGQAPAIFGSNEGADFLGQAPKIA